MTHNLIIIIIGEALWHKVNADTLKRKLILSTLWPLSLAHGWAPQVNDDHEDTDDYGGDEDQDKVTKLTHKEFESTDLKWLKEVTLSCLWHKVSHYKTTKCKNTPFLGVVRWSQCLPQVAHFWSQLLFQGRKLEQQQDGEMFESWLSSSPNCSVALSPPDRRVLQGEANPQQEPSKEPRWQVALIVSVRSSEVRIVRRMSASRLKGRC